MTQNELNRAVARATGESVSLISSMGFVPLSDTPHEREPQTVDWDKTQQNRRVSLQPRRQAARIHCLKQSHPSRPRMIVRGPFLPCIFNQKGTS